MRLTVVIVGCCFLLSCHSLRWMGTVKSHRKRIISLNLRNNDIPAPWPDVVDDVQKLRKNAGKAMASLLWSWCVLSNAAPCIADSTSNKYPMFNEVWGIVNENFVDPTYNNHDWSAIKVKYLKRLDSGANEEEITKDMLKVLGDKYTRLLSKSVFESIWKYDAIGIGLLFQSDPGKQMVVAAPPIAGSSSEKAGIKKDDVVYSINGVSTDGMTAIQLLDMMSNDQSDHVRLEYGTKGAAESSIGQPLRKTVTLARSTEKASNPISYYTQRLPSGENIAYVRLSEFNAEAVPGLRNALNDLQKGGAETIDELVLDLRGNTGGGFQFALNIGGMFMEKDTPMVTAVGRDAFKDKSDFKTSYPEGVLYKKPLIVLEDGLSASASEVLISGLHDNCRAAVVGEPSFGKGKIQAVFGLADGEGLTMTVAQYVSPKGEVIQSKGIPPDLRFDTLNPYLGALLGPGLTKPDLSKIDYKAANEIVTQCKASSS